MREERIDLYHVMFERMNDDLGVQINDVLKKIYDEEFEAGTISLKLDLCLKTVDEVTEEDEYYSYKTPDIDYKIVSDLKKRKQKSGNASSEGKEIQKDDLGLKLVDVEPAQMDMF